MSVTPDQFDNLLAATREGTIDADGWARLQALLAGDRKLRRRYIRSVMLSVDLAERFGDVRVANPMRRCDMSSVNAVFRSRSGARHGWKIAAAVVFAAAALAVALIVLTGGPQTPADTDGEDTPLGVVVDTDNPVWESAPVWSGDDVTARPIRLAGGSATFAMLDGATVTISGPTDCTLTSGASARLGRGSIAVRAPDAVGGFTVHTPAVTVVDLGTEFRVDVDDDGRTSVLVTEGRVRVTPAVESGDGSGSVVLDADRMAEFAPGGRLITPPQSGAALLGRNLVVNGDFEAGPFVPIADERPTDVAIEGWIDATRATVLEYGHGVAGGYPDPSSEPMPAERGGRYFVAMDEGETAQSIDVAPLAAAIDAGRVAADLSAWLGGFADQNDHVIVRAHLLDADGAELSVIELASVASADRLAELGADRNGRPMTGFVRRSGAGALPAGVRRIRVTITGVPHAGPVDGYVDNVALTLGLSRATEQGN